MIKQHTTRSLDRYMGMEAILSKKHVYHFSNLKEYYKINPPDTEIVNSKGINLANKIFILEKYNPCGWFEMRNENVINVAIPEIIFPLLKDYTHLTVEDKLTVYDCKELEIDYDFSIYSHNSDYIIPSDVKKILIELGYGAIENAESPTSYVDLWGYPCVLKEKKQ